MNVRKLALASTAIIALSSISASGALADSANGTVSATVFQAAVVTLAAPNFGGINVAGTGGATLAPDGTVTGSGGYTAANTGSQGVATITQSSGTVDITVSLDDLVGTAVADTLEATALNVTGPGAPITGSANDAAGSVTATAAGSTLGGATTAAFNIGASVTDDGTAPPAGTYQGTLTVTVNNQ